MNRYLLFAGEDYYPSGGWDDFLGSFETIEQARTHLEEVDNPARFSNKWAQIVDLETGEKVLEGYHKPKIWTDLRKPK